MSEIITADNLRLRRRRSLSRTDSPVAEARRLWLAGSRQASEDLLTREVERSTSFGAAHALYIDLLLSEGRRQAADTIFELGLQFSEASGDALDGLAFYARRLDRHELSNTLYRRAVEVAPHDGQLWYNLATSERSLGRLSAAIEACERALEVQPGVLPALLLRSELSIATDASNHVDDLRARLSSDPGDRAQMFTAYALGKELHDLRRYDEAFEAFARGAAVRRKHLSYDVADDERKLSRIEQVYDSPPQQRPPLPGLFERHIFIVGLPRSGTTLTERILSALPGVRSNGETNNFSSALLQCAPQTGGDVFERCRRAPAAEIARIYSSFAVRQEPADWILEKLPLNYLYVGAIAAAFPNAPIVWVRRHPVDSCFAMFRTLFGEGYPFSYDFGDLARYYAAYERLMRHWCRTMPGRLIEIDYEQLVAHPATVGQELAQRCGLAWTQQAIDLSQNRAPSLTASAAQVRGPIYSTSSGIWKVYGRHLEPLIQQLRKAGVAVH